MAGRLDLAQAIDAIPVVADAATRDAVFALAVRRLNQRVYRLDTGAVERWTGVSWVDTALPQLPQNGRTTPTLGASLANNAVFNAKDFGAIADGVSHPLSAFFATLGAAQAIYPHATALTNEIDWAAVQGAVNAASAVRGGRVRAPVGLYLFDQQLKGKNGVVIDGDGPGNYSTITTSATVFKPTVGFAPSSVVLEDPNNHGGGLFITGCGLNDVLFDMDNVSGTSKIAYERRSVSNPAPCRNVTVINQDSGQYLLIGRSTSPGAQVSDGLTFYDFYGLSKTVDPANTDPCVIIEEANEIAFLGARTKWGRKSGGTPVAGTVACLIRTNGASGVNAVTLDGGSLTGCETGAKTTYLAGTGPGVRYVRVLNVTFEVYTVGVLFTGDATHLSQFCWTFGNRFISGAGAVPANMKLDYAGNCQIFSDMVAAPPSGYVVDLTANAMANLVFGGQSTVATGVRDLGTNNVVLALGSNGRLLIGTRTNATSGLEMDAAASGTPSMRLLRNGIVKGLFGISDGRRTDEVQIATATAVQGFAPAGQFFANDNNQILDNKRQTGWGTPTGTPARGAFNADATTTASAGYVQAELQAVNDRLLEARRELAALVLDLRAHGLIGT